MKRTLGRLVAFVLTLALLATPALAQESATYREGDEGVEIKEFKLRLYELGYFSTDNLSRKFSQATTEAVMAFQTENGLEPTGEVTPETWTLLFSDAARAFATPTPSPAPTPTPEPTPVPTPYVDYPERDRDGYLLGAGEYVYENDDAGIWIYLTQSLQNQHSKVQG